MAKEVVTSLLPVGLFNRSSTLSFCNKVRRGGVFGIQASVLGTQAGVFDIRCNLAYKRYSTFVY